MSEDVQLAVPHPFPLEYCRSCNAPIFWGQTIMGRRMPVDFAPQATGNIEIADASTTPPVVAAQTRPTAPQRFVSHFATCPNAVQHRTRNRRR